MKNKLIATLILAGSSLFAGPRIAVGIGFGASGRRWWPWCLPARVLDYVFVDGYWQLQRPVFEHRVKFIRCISGWISA